MGLASAVHHGGGIRISLNFHLRVASVSPTVQLPRWTGFRFSNHRVSLVHSVSHNRRTICFPVARSKGMEQEDHLSRGDLFYLF
ncbi:hypothetical protein Gotri_023376 [Gossypium trilobum]|uniref:Uncharacterized protein n=1 Tax=Gossypium trilobum TaxID=34281 RepID=A0A7J9DIV1_9ROSI|nr:hypothetical protein [Gossypium trilobum]